MPIYQLPDVDVKKQDFLNFGKTNNSIRLSDNFLAFSAIFLIGIFLGVFAVYANPNLENSGSNPILSTTAYTPQTTHEETVISAVKNASDSVVSVVISKEVPVYKKVENDNSDVYDPFGFFNLTPQYEQNGTEKQEVGQGSGFFVTEDGMILTNKHVAYDSAAEYTVITSNGKEYKAKILSRDPVQDLAILKVDSTDKFKPLKLGDASSIRIGQTAIAIGNALGEFQNTVSVGVISGLGRTITASSGVSSETLEDTIQTDAAINQGNSGGPLLNLKGEVIGINTAVSSVGQGLGFAISIDKAKRDIEQTKTTGKISYPFLGIRYVLLDEKVAKLKNLSVTYGALILKGTAKGDVAVTKGSPAEKAGLKEGDIVLEVNGEKISTSNSLSKVISKYKAGDNISLKTMRGTSQTVKVVTLGEWETSE
ncbi:MAG: trypsin-like peptidase domain-containing protein [Candidatus Paceibacterota bacterium]